MDFGCKRVDASELIKCTFGLNKTEHEIFTFLLKSRACLTAAELGDKLSLDRTTIQKAMKKLFERDIVERRQNNLDKGGYVFFYCVKKKKLIKEKMMNIIKEWNDLAQQEIEYLFGD